MKKIYITIFIVLGFVLTAGAQAVKRPLVEEYTGLWCSFCPRGFVALEEMSEQYGENFVAISYHYNDDMDMGYLPTKVGSYPNGSIDRRNLMDPISFKTVYKRYLEEEVPFDVKVDAEWDTDASEPTIKATATLEFMEDASNASYKIAHVLVADSLYNPGWLQRNAFGGFSEEAYPGKWWDLFIHNGSLVSDLIFNDVAVYSDNLQGELVFLHAKFNEGSTISFETSIPVSKVVNKNRQNIVNEYGSFEYTRVVTMVIDYDTDRVLNCNSSLYPGKMPEYETGSGIRDIESEIVETVYYTLDGLRIDNPQKGIFIKKEVRADGTSNNSKVIL